MQTPPHRDAVEHAHFNWKQNIICSSVTDNDNENINIVRYILEKKSQTKN